MNPLAMLGYDGSTLGGALQDFLKGASVKTLGLAGLQGVSSVASTMAAMGATRAQGAADKMAYQLSALDELRNADQAFVSGVGEVAGLRKSLVNALGQRMAQSTGLDGGVGVVQDNARKISENSRIAEGVARSNADIMASRHRMNAIVDMMKGDAAERAAKSAAAGQLGSGLLGGLLSIGKLFLP